MDVAILPRLGETVDPNGVDPTPERINRLDRLDAVDHPPHYRATNGMEAIDVIESFGLNFNLGNAAKYLLRQGKKGDPLTDLKKCVWYVQREIAAREKAK